MKIVYVKKQYTADGNPNNVDLRPPQGKQWRVVAATGHHSDDDARVCTWSFKDDDGGREMWLNQVTLATNIRSSPYNDFTGAYGIGAIPFICRYRRYLRFNAAALDTSTIATVNAIVEEEDGPDD